MVVSLVIFVYIESVKKTYGKHTQTNDTIVAKYIKIPFKITFINRKMPTTKIKMKFTFVI